MDLPKDRTQCRLSRFRMATFNPKQDQKFKPPVSSLAVPMQNRNGFKHSALYANAHRTLPFFSFFLFADQKEK
jgi:hypothetical protein